MQNGSRLPDTKEELQQIRSGISSGASADSKPLLYENGSSKQNQVGEPSGGKAGVLRHHLSKSVWISPEDHNTCSAKLQRNLSCMRDWRIHLGKVLAALPTRMRKDSRLDIKSAAPDFGSLFVARMYGENVHETL